MFSTSADAQVTIFPASSTPGTIDHGNPAPTELGVQFKSDTTGYITGLRFYKATTNTGTHVAHLWTTSGVLLQSATFTNETASGWQQVNFATPVQVTANTVYIASYWAPVGHYSIDFNYFKTKGVDNAPLHALQNGVNGGNGVYFHASKSKFPSANYESSNFWVDVVYSAQATAANPQLSVSASTLSFGSIAVNSSTTASVTLTSSGTSPLTVNSAAVSGTGFSLAAGTFPTTLNPNSSMTLQVQFKPTASGAATGQLTIGSNSTTGSSTVVSLSGTGAAANPQLNVNTSTLGFGSVAVNTAAAGSVTLTSTGSSPVTVNSASISGTGFSITGGSFPATLNPNQTMAVQLQFKPTASGSATGQLTISSNSTTGSSAAVALSGTGTATAEQVNLSWIAPSNSTDPVAGYNIYRALGSGAFQLVNSGIDTKTTYVDSSVSSGNTYNYLVKSVDQSGVESTGSNEISVAVP
ncbi:DUF4082 domain-containing protein [Tunturiibacter lichenicola]|jgi:Domain of unknown function (DUF4082)/Abnormal spindle-like microcephaly-assoc'd, ASPM-SPD-2-Hydin|uniref:DUF4082 domain-containing protein n=1 Tax=Tunturiibacter lichenicola TaxID=2051959 RepID=UPI003D9BCBCC